MIESSATYAVWWLLGLPVVAAVVLATMPSRWKTPWINAGASLMTLLAALWLVARGTSFTGTYLFVDELNAYLIALNAFVAFTTSIYSASYIGYELAHGRFTPMRARIYHFMYQALTFSMNLALLANNIGLMWVAIEVATLTTVLMVGIYQTPAALEAAWKYFVLGSVGIALALFGTILVYLAAQAVMGEGLDAMTWSRLFDFAGSLDPVLLNLAFVFLLLGYGTKVGLVPLHAWLPDAHAEGPTPISAVLSGLMLNVALYAVLRFKTLIGANSEALDPGPLLMVIGLVSVIIGSFMLYRRWEIKRLFAYSSIEHMGILAFAFGLGGPLANFAGLLHMAMHSLTKTAIFFAVGHVTQIKGSGGIINIRGLTVSNPVLGWSLAIGVLAIVGLPPMGVFMSEFLLVSAAIAEAPVMAVILVAGLLISFGCLVLRLHGFLFGAASHEPTPVQVSYVPIFAHLMLVAIAGVYLPAPLVAWFQRISGILG